MTATPIDQLFSRVADGDRSAVEPAFEALWPPVRRYCLKLLPSEQDAEDATQASLIKMFEQASQYDRRRPVIGWALAFAYWECRTINTRRLRDGERLAPLPDEPYPTSVESPELVLQQEELRRTAQTLLSSLTPEERELLDGRIIDVESSLIQLSPAARRKRKQRLIERLRQTFLDIIRPGGRA